jgi:hypothetical protein
MRCEYAGQEMDYRIAAEAGTLRCCSGNPCPYKAGDVILTLPNPLKPGEMCESAVTQTIFDTVFKVIA